MANETNDYDLNQRIETLKKVQTRDEELNLIYQWIKTGMLSGRQFIDIMKWIEGD